MALMASFLVDPTTAKARQEAHNEPVTLLCVEDVARLLNVAPQTIYKWVRTGYIPYLKLGKCVRFSRAAVLQWLAERESKGRTTRLPDLEEVP